MAKTIQQELDEALPLPELDDVVAILKGSSRGAALYASQIQAKIGAEPSDVQERERWMAKHGEQFRDSVHAMRRCSKFADLSNRTENFKTVGIQLRKDILAAFGIVANPEED